MTRLCHDTHCARPTLFGRRVDHLICIIVWHLNWLSQWRGIWYIGMTATAGLLVNRYWCTVAVVPQSLASFSSHSLVGLCRSVWPNHTTLSDILCDSAYNINHLAFCESSCILRVDKTLPLALFGVCHRAPSSQVKQPAHWFRTNQVVCHLRVLMVQMYR